MTVQEVVLRALSGEIHWFRAAEILGMSPRTLRRWRERYETHGLRWPGGQAPAHAVGAARGRGRRWRSVLQLYRARYQGFNARHFHEVVRRDPRGDDVYSFLKQALQTGGPGSRSSGFRGRDRRRREPRACFGELLHIDGSRHAWFAPAPDPARHVIAIPDDATNRVLYAQLWEAESARAVMTALGEVVTTHGPPVAEE